MPRYDVVCALVLLRCVYREYSAVYQFAWNAGVLVPVALLWLLLLLLLLLYCLYDYEPIRRLVYDEHVVVLISDDDDYDDGVVGALFFLVFCFLCTLQFLSICRYVVVLLGSITAAASV